MANGERAPMDVRGWVAILAASIIALSTSSFGISEARIRAVYQQVYEHELGVTTTAIDNLTGSVRELQTLMATHLNPALYEGHPGMQRRVGNLEQEVWKE